ETHEPLQLVSPAPQTSAHCPELHTLLEPHAWPHPPQFAGSADVSTQVLAQSVWPWGQTHDPPEHALPPMHEVPHAPQFALSDPVSTQAPVQFVRPPVH